MVLSFIVTEVPLHLFEDLKHIINNYLLTLFYITLRATVIWYPYIFDLITRDGQLLHGLIPMRHNYVDT